MLKWKQYQNIHHWFASAENGAGYDVQYMAGWRWIALGCWIAIYNEGSKMHGYLSDRCRVEIPMGSSGLGEKPNCQFSTKEEAMTICERHNKLLVLQ